MIRRVLLALALLLAPLHETAEAQQSAAARRCAIYLCGGAPRPTLDFNFLTMGGTLPSIITYTGASLATLTNSAGNVAYKPHNFIRNSTMQGAVAADGVERITNGTFGGTLTGWTSALNGGTGAIAASGNSANITGDGTHQSNLTQSITTVIGTTYNVIVTIATNNVFVQAGNIQGSSALLGSTVAVGVGQVVQFTATATTTWIGFAVTSAVTSNVSAISVKSFGVNPTNWTMSDSATGITFSLVNVTSESGFAALDYQVSGTANTSGTLSLVLEGTAPALNGQNWLTSAYLKYVAGTAPGIVRVETDELTGAGAFLAGTQTSIVPTSTLTRYTGPRVNSQATTGLERALFQFVITNGQVVNFTFRVAAPQMEQQLSSAANSPAVFNPTTSAAYFGPRFDYSPSSVGTLNGLLNEEARTNLLLQSNFASGWTFTSASFTQGALTGPDGVAASAVKLVEAAATAQHFTTIGSITIAANATVTGSVWLQQGERTTATVRISDGAISTGASVLVNLATNSVTSTSTFGTGTVLGSSATAYSNGWTRYTITGTIDAVSTTARLNVMLQTGASYLGDGTSGAYLFGAQFEAGAFATSYIPTSVATATRVQDLATVATSAFAYNPNGGTMVANVIPMDVTSKNRAVMEIDDGATTNRVALRSAITTGLVVQLSLSASVTTTQFSTANALTANVLAKLGTAWALADGAVVLNAGVVSTSAAGTPLPVNITTLRLGDGPPAGNQTFNGWLVRDEYFNRRVNNTQLQGFTR